MRDIYAGIDFGGTNTKIAIIDETGKIIARTSFPTIFPFDKSKWINSVKKTLELITKDKYTIKAIGVGVAGLVDVEKGIVLNAPNIEKIDNWKIKNSLEKVFNIPVFVDNDVNVITLGEYLFQEKKGVKNMVVITLGTGVGGGLILNGEIYRGASFVAGEVGHLTINENGPICNCGNKGCIEAYIGNRRIVERFKSILKKYPSEYYRTKKQIERITPYEIYKTALKKDKASLVLWEEFASSLSTMISVIVNLLNPEKIILGGGVANAFPIFRKKLNDELKKKTLLASLKNLVIEKSKLGDDAGLIGAVKLVMDKV